MKEPIRILHLEDDPADRELTRANLDAAGLKYRITSVQTGAEYEQALRQGGYDVILADFRLPTYDGLSALRLAQDLCPDVPFIFVSGTMGEDAAIEGLTKGATDYVLKQKLSRLVPAIKRALTEAENKRERKQAEEKLKKSEERYRLVIENTAHSITIFDLNLKPTEYIAPSILKRRGYTVQEALTQTLDQTLTPDSLQLASKIFAEQMALESSGTADPARTALMELEEYCKDGSTIWVEIVASFLRDNNFKPTAIVTVARDITDRKQAEEQLKETLDRLRKAIEATVQVMVSAVETRDPYTAGHQLRSADLARSIAMEMGLDQERIEGIRMAGIIHDIGKLSIPSEILSKPTKLTDLELSLIKEHSRIGYEILKNIESPWPLADIVCQHHERINGSGYPGHLKMDETLLESRILAVADVVEAMASHRPYRASLGIEAALKEIEQNKGILYDADVVDACLKLFREKGYQLIKDGETNPI